MNRFEKVEFLRETCALGIMPAEDSDFFNEMIRWMSEDEFEEFFDNFCSNHDFCKSYEELNKVVPWEVSHV